MPKIQTAIPVLPAANVAETIEFYAKLGFKETFRDADKPNYAGLARDGVGFHISALEPKLARTVASQTMCRFAVKDVDALYKEFAKHKGVIHPNCKGVDEKPWGTREFAVLDPTGVCVTFFVDK